MLTTRPGRTVPMPDICCFAVTWPRPPWPAYHGRVQPAQV